MYYFSVVQGQTFTMCHTPPGVFPPPPTQDDLNPKKCFEKCKEVLDGEPFSYFGVQNGNECWCDTGDSEIDYKKHGISHGCTIDCTAWYDDRDTCGGSWAMQVYRLN